MTSITLPQYPLEHVYAFVGGVVVCVKTTQIYLDTDKFISHNALLTLAKKLLTWCVGAGSSKHKDTVVLICLEILLLWRYSQKTVSINIWIMSCPGSGPAGNRALCWAAPHTAFPTSLLTPIVGWEKTGRKKQNLVGWGKDSLKEEHK